ncbi:unnamed protein product, partial [Ilex paraguariensis]
MEISLCYAPLEVTETQGFVTPFRLPGKHLQNCRNVHHWGTPLGCCGQRFLTLANNLRSYKEQKTPNKHKLAKRSIFSGKLEHKHASAPKNGNLTTFQTDLCERLYAFYRFSRPHTVIGTVIGITSVSLLPLESMADLSLAFLVGLLKALIPSILMNIYVVGLNQLFDVEIDKVNKPNLPLASGEFSVGIGVTIVSTCLLM